MVENILNKSVTVGTDPTVISVEQNNAQRSLLMITNISTGGQVVSLAFREEAQAGKGIVLNVGGFYTESLDAGFKPTNSQLTAVSSAAGATLAIHERVLFDSYKY